MKSSEPHPASAEPNDGIQVRLPIPEQPPPQPRTVIDQSRADAKVAAPAGESANTPTDAPATGPGSTVPSTAPSVAARAPESSTPPQRPDPTHSSSMTTAVGRAVPNRTTYELVVDGAATGQGFASRVDADSALEKTRGLYPGRRVEVREVSGVGDLAARPLHA